MQEVLSAQSPDVDRHRRHRQAGWQAGRQADRYADTSFSQKNIKEKAAYEQSLYCSLVWEREILQLKNSNGLQGTQTLMEKPSFTRQSSEKSKVLLRLI